MLGSIVGATAQNINTLIGAEVLIGISAAFQISFFWVIAEMVPMRWRYLANSYAYMVTIPTSKRSEDIAPTRNIRTELTISSVCCQIRWRRRLLLLFRRLPSNGEAPSGS